MAKSAIRGLRTGTDPVTGTDHLAGTLTASWLQAAAGRAVRALGRIEVVGADRIPSRGPVLLAMNHRSMLDGAIMCSLSPRPIACLVKSEAFIVGIGPLLERAGQIPVVRQRVDPKPIRECVAILRAGGVVGLFPEGTRGDGLVRRIKPGVGYFALRSGAVVVPIACSDTTQLLQGWRRKRVSVLVGEPMVFPRYPDGQPLNRRPVAAAGEVIRHALAALVISIAPTATPPASTIARRSTA